jgi:hypothetical protein
LLSAVTGFVVLRFASPAASQEEEETRQEAEIELEGDVQRLEETT